MHQEAEPDSPSQLSSGPAWLLTIDYFKLN